MERYPHLAVADCDSVNSPAINFPRNFTAVERGGRNADYTVSEDWQLRMRESTSRSFEIPNFNGNVRSLTSTPKLVQPTSNFGRRTPGAGAPLARPPPAAATMAVRPRIAPRFSAPAAAHRRPAEGRPLATTSFQATPAGPLDSSIPFHASTRYRDAEAACAEEFAAGEQAVRIWTGIAKKHRRLNPNDGQDDNTLPDPDAPAKTAQQIIWELINDPTFDRIFLLQLVQKKLRSKLDLPTPDVRSHDKIYCKFCRNNNEEEIYHQFKDADGLVVCPVLSKHVCDLCGVTGPFAHTRKYCPKNPLTLGCPKEGRFPPGILPKDIYETTQAMLKVINLK